MRLLLDSHAFLWWADTSERLSPLALAACESVENSLYLSLASLWELQLKINLEKLQLNGTLADIISKQRGQGLQLLEIAPDHIYATAKLPMIHADPFDRLLVAQATIEGMTLVTADRKLMQYAVEVLW